MLSPDRAWPSCVSRIPLRPGGTGRSRGAVAECPDAPDPGHAPAVHRRLTTRRIRGRGRTVAGVRPLGEELRQVPGRIPPAAGEPTRDARMPTDAELVRTVGGVGSVLPRVFRARLPCPCHFRRFHHTGPVPVGPEPGSCHECLRLPHADPRKHALLPIPSDAFLSVLSDALRRPLLLADGRARSAVGSHPRGPGEPSVPVGRPRRGARRRAGAADSRLGPPADGRREGLPAHRARGAG